MSQTCHQRVSSPVNVGEDQFRWRNAKSGRLCLKELQKVWAAEL